MRIPESMYLPSLEIIESLVDRIDVKVFRAVYKNQLVLLKVHENESSFIRETDSLIRLREKNAPVPRIWKTKKIDDHYVFLEEWWDGKTLAELFPHLNRSNKRRLIHEIGRLLAKIHTSLSEAELKQAEFWKQIELQTLEDFSWKSYLQKQCNKWIHRLKLRSTDIDKGIRISIDHIRSSLLELQEPKTLRLLHNDFVLRNIMGSNHGEQILGLIDFEHVSIGDPVYDLVKLIWSDLDPDDHELQTKYLSGYEAETGQTLDYTRLCLYKAISGLAAVQWVDKKEYRTEENEKFREKGLRMFLNNCEQN